MNLTKNHIFKYIEGHLHIMLSRNLWYLAIVSHSAPINQKSDEIDIEHMPHPGPVWVFYLILAQLNIRFCYKISTHICWTVNKELSCQCLKNGQQKKIKIHCFLEAWRKLALMFLSTNRTTRYITFSRSRNETLVRAIIRRMSVFGLLQP